MKTPKAASRPASDGALLQGSARWSVMCCSSEMARKWPRSSWH